MKALASLVEPLIARAGRGIARLRDRRRRFRHELAVCAIFKDEARDLGEWLTFHAGVGVEHFYLYNDASSDAYLAVLEPWLRSGRVTLVDWNGRGQRHAYDDCIARHRMQARWIAFIDLDEFLFSPEHPDLRRVLADYRDVSSLFVYWVLFGSSGHGPRPAGPVVEAYTRCLDHDAAIADDFDHADVPGKPDYVSGWAQDGKSIVNPRRVRKYNIHKPRSLWFGEILDESRKAPRVRGEASQLCYSRLRINHYWSKSIQDLTEKVARGSVCNPRRPPRKLSRWLEREAMLNRSEDRTILPIWHGITSAGKADE